MSRGTTIIADNIHKLTKFVTLYLFDLIPNNYTYNTSMILSLIDNHISISLTLHRTHLLMIPSSSLPLLGWDLRLFLSSWWLILRWLPLGGWSLDDGL
jgi:hypothetical protein